MENISEFTEKVIGAEMEIYHWGLDSDERDTEYFVIDTIDEQDNGTYNVISEKGTVINMPSLDDIEKAVDGEPFYLIRSTTYNKIFRKAHHHFIEKD